MRGCPTCERDGHRSHDTSLPKVERCPESYERMRERQRRYEKSDRGREVHRDANHKYAGTAKGMLSSMRHDANRRGAGR
jgi:hypothetical protein